MVKLGEQVQALRKADGSQFPKQENVAKAARIPRQQVIIVENGLRSYRLESLLQILSVFDPDPVLAFLAMSRNINTLDMDEIDALRLVLAAMNDHRRTATKAMLKSLKNLEEEEVSATTAAKARKNKSPPKPKAVGH